MEADFLSWLRAQGTCGNCEWHCGGECEEYDKLLPDLRVVAPIQTFTVDRDAPAESCDLWEPRSDWADDMRRSYEMDCEEAASARKHQLDVAAHKGFEVAA